MKNKPQIAMIGLTGLHSYGGAESVGESLINLLEHKYGFSIYSISSHADEKTSDYKGIGKQIVLRAFRFRKFISLFYCLRSAFHSMFCSYNINHVHHRAVTMVLPFLRLKFLVVLTTHGMQVETKFETFSWFFFLQDHIFMSWAFAVTTVSMKDIDIVRNKMGIKENKTQFILNGINVKQKTIYELKDNKNSSLLYAAARIFDSKGCHILLDALKKVDIDYIVRIIVKIKQNQKYESKLKELASNLPNVRFLELIMDKRKLFSYIKNAAMSIYPSNTESLSMMILWVTSLKTPFMLVDIRVNKDVFSDKKPFILNPKNPLIWHSKSKWD